VAFSDDDSWWAPGALHRAVEALRASPRLGLVAARVLVGPDGRLDPTSDAMATSPLPRHPGTGCPTVIGFLACGAVVRCEAFLGAGAFHPEVGIPGEEALLALDLLAAGWQLVYVPSVVARHHPEPTGDRRHRARRQVANAMLVAWMRLPPVSAWRATLQAVREADGVATGLLGSLDALRRWRCAISSRRRVPTWLDDRLRLIRADQAQLVRHRGRDGLDIQLEKPGIGDRAVGITATSGPEHTVETTGARAPSRGVGGPEEQD